MDGCINLINFPLLAQYVVLRVDIHKLPHHGIYKLEFRVTPSFIAFHHSIAIHTAPFQALIELNQSVAII